MTAEETISPEQIREVVHYDPKTGLFIWKSRPPATRFARQWNSRNAGKPAFVSDDGRGYLWGKVFDRKIRAHRAAWAWVNGEWPLNQIDHINGVRSDNRISNLRDVAAQENMRNRRPYKKDSGLPPGVKRCRSRYRAIVCVNGERVSLGSFATPEEAHAAYRGACRVVGFHPNHSR